MSDENAAGDEFFGPEWRPRAWIASVEFNDGTRLELGRHEVVVLVGPNNGGKSRTLLDVYMGIQDPVNKGIVVTSVSIGARGDVDSVVAWAKRNYIKAAQEGSPDNIVADLPFGRLPLSALTSDWPLTCSNRGLRRLTPLIATFLSTESRLQAANPVQSINSVTEIATAPLQQLYEKDEQELRLSRLFRQAFSQDLVLNRSAGSQIVLHFGKRPVPPRGKDRLSIEYRTAVHALPQVQSQGDGIRAFAGVLLHVLVVDRDIVLIDEPEAFLHPPQAVILGRMLARETPNPRQLIVATHSTDFLRGLLDIPDSPVRVIRIRRMGARNRIKELAPDTVRMVWRDPLLRYSKVLDGLFHDAVIVCEADADCRFYGAMMDAVAGTESTPDLLLVHAGGKTRVPTIVHALQAIAVPVRAILDFDVLNKEHDIRGIFESLGGRWSDVERDWRIVRSAIESRRPELPTNRVKEQMRKILDAVTGDAMPTESIAKIREVLKGASAWSEAKRMGKAFVPSGEQSVAYVNLEKRLRSHGLNQVECGELEQFCKTIADHGPGWLHQVLERDLANDPELDEARKFAQLLLEGWGRG